MSSTIETLQMTEDLFLSDEQVCFLTKTTEGNGTVIVTMPHQRILKKKGPDETVPGGVMVEPSKELKSAFRAIKRTVPVGTVFVTRTLRSKRKGLAEYYICSDLFLLKNCPETIKEKFNKIYNP